MTQYQYRPPTAQTRNDEPVRRNWPRRVLIALALAIILPLVLFLARENWRARTLLTFCKAAQPGITFGELLGLEKLHSIDESYLVQANLVGYIDQASSHDLEFRSHIYDPDFACAIVHDGERVKHVQLLTLEGFDPN